MTWTQRLKRAMKVGYFNRQDRLVAESWDTCAVGETWPGERAEYTTPKIRRLGMKFFRRVERSDPSGAVVVFLDIKALRG